MSSDSLLISRLTRLGKSEEEAEKIVRSMEGYEVKRALADGSYLRALIALKSGCARECLK
jgi:hypothetical protein